MIRRDNAWNYESMLGPRAELPNSRLEGHHLYLFLYFFSLHLPFRLTEATRRQFLLLIVNRAFVDSLDRDVLERRMVGVGVSRSQNRFVSINFVGLEARVFRATFIFLLATKCKGHGHSFLSPF